MATLPKDPDQVFESSKEVGFRILENRLGDGYTQRAADGINNHPEIWTWVWNSLSYTDFVDIETALKNTGGHTAIEFTPSGESVVKKFKCIKYNTVTAEDKAGKITAQVEQVFDL